MKNTVSLYSRLPTWRDPILYSKASDIVAVLIALSLPWSTSLVSIFGVVFALMVAPTIERRAFAASLQRPISALPIALFVLAVLGTLWSEAPRSALSYALGPVAKFLVLPLLVYHFERSARGMWVLNAFLISCILMMVMSWSVTFYPGLALKKAEPGIFVKNYIDQSQEFALCAVVLVYPIYALLRNGKIWQPLLLAAIAMSFIVNMAFVIVSRTAIVTLPILLGVFAILHLKWRARTFILGAMILLSSLAFTASPQLRYKISMLSSEYELYKEQDRPTSVGLRLEFWQKSLRFFAEAPIIGHGTGAARGLFQRAASGNTDFASGYTIDNPHNQTLNMAIQWGSVGIFVLYTMWLVHFLHFRGEGLLAWTGIMVVLQNFLSSLFNSHLFDFHEGWMYVLGVGVIGGMMLRAHPEKA